MPLHAAVVKMLEAVKKEAEILGVDKTVKPGEYFDLISLKGKGIVESIHLLISEIDYRYIEIELIIDDKCFLLGALDNLNELVERVGFGVHELKQIPMVLVFKADSYRIVWYPDAPYYESLTLRIINNHTASSMKVHKGSLIIYRVV